MQNRVPCIENVTRRPTITSKVVSCTLTIAYALVSIAVAQRWQNEKHQDIYEPWQF